MKPADPRRPLAICIGLLGPALLLVVLALSGCEKRPSVDSAFAPFLNNHSPVIDSLVAYPDTIGPSDSTMVVCFARDSDGDPVVFDWLTDARLRIPGRPDFADTYLNNQPSSRLTFYNRALDRPINDSAWVYCSARDGLGGGSGRHVFIVLRR